MIVPVVKKSFETCSEYPWKHRYELPAQTRQVGGNKGNLLNCACSDWWRAPSVFQSGRRALQAHPRRQGCLQFRCKFTPLSFSFSLKKKPRNKEGFVWSKREREKALSWRGGLQPGFCCVSVSVTEEITFDRSLCTLALEGPHLFTHLQVPLFEKVHFWSVC